MKLPTHDNDVSRRKFVGDSGKMVLSAGAIALLGSSRGVKAAEMDPVRDINILNVAVELEYQGIYAYEAAIHSGLLESNVAKTAAKFQSDHKVHVDALIGTIRQLGGEPVPEKSTMAYTSAFGLEKMTSQREVLELAVNLELGAANAYLSVIPSLTDPELAKVAARLAADEVGHWSLLNFDLGRDFMPALGFGA